MISYARLPTKQKPGQHCKLTGGDAGDDKGRATPLISHAAARQIDNTGRNDLVIASSLNRDLANREVTEMIDARRLYDACFHAAVAVSQAFIAVVAGVAVAFALWS